MYQFTRTPFGVTNGVAGFQRTLDDIIESEELRDTFAYVDNITICGNTQEEHDANLNKFLDVAKKHNMTFNDDKSIISTTSIQLLGHMISKGTIRPDPDRLRPLQELPAPHNLASQRRIVGIFAHYSKWIPKFSEKVRPLTQNKIFPVPSNVLHAF